MTFAGGSGTDYLGFKDILIAQPPWIRDGSVTNVWSPDTRGITWFSGSGDGGIASGIAATVGSNALVVQNNVSFHNSLISTSQGFRADSGTSSAAISAATGAAASGSKIPISFAIAGRLPTAPNYLGATGAQWVLFSFSRDASVNPYFAVIGTRGSTDCALQRRDDSGAMDAGTTLSLGTSAFVLIGVYSGSTFTTRLNGVVKDNAAAASTSGTSTFDKVSIGGFIRAGASGLYSDLYWSHMILGVNKTWTSSTYLPIESYLRRRLGV